MFDNINWEKIINIILEYVKRDWKYLTIKIAISKSSYSMKYYYSNNGKEYIDINKLIDNDKVFSIMDDIADELDSLINKFESNNEKMFITIEVEKNGNVKVRYSDIKNSDKLPYDEEIKYLSIKGE